MKKIENRGITLIALVITIIILLILAGVAISSLAESGLFGKAKIAKMRSEYASAKEKVEMKLMEIQTDCVENEKEYTIEEIAKNIKEDKEITIEKYYNSNTASIKSGITENLVNLSGIVVSVDEYSEYKFLIGKNCEIEGITIEEITDTTDQGVFKPKEEFEKEVLGKVQSNSNGSSDTTEEIKDIPGVGEDVDTTNPIEIATYMVVKSNSKNILNLKGVENAIYTIQEKTTNLSFSENILVANSNADSSDSCKIQITGTYNGQSYTNNLTVYVEPKNKTTVEDKEGNKQEAFAIYTVQDLVRIQELVNSKVNETLNAKMMNDIDLGGIEWTPIGIWKANENISTTSFKGIFEGNNYTINNIKINGQDSNYWGAGFIGVLEGGILKNVKFNNSYIETQRTCSGIVVGYSYNNSLIENVKILSGKILDGEIINTDGSDIGGICGANELNSVIRNCYNNSNVEVQNFSVGGICGSNSSGATVEKCYNSGIITGLFYVGGICGANYNNSTIDSCYNTSNITSIKKHNTHMASTGGIAGGNWLTSTVKNCYNIGDITSTYTYVGGIVGYNGSSSEGTQTVENVFNTGTITKGTVTATTNIGTSSNYVGTLIGRYGSLTGNYENTTVENMSAWDSETILQNLGENFKMNTNSNLNEGLPLLNWQ